MLSRKTGLPLNDLENASRALPRDEDQVDGVSVATSTFRPKNESLEEKKARKAAVKDAQVCSISCFFSFHSFLEWAWTF